MMAGEDVGWRSVGMAAACAQPLTIGPELGRFHHRIPPATELTNAAIAQIVTGGDGAEERMPSLTRRSGGGGRDDITMRL